MRDLINILLLCCLSILGCKNPVVKNTTLHGYTDSFIVAEQDKVIGNLKFGMIKDSAEQEIAKFKMEHKSGGRYAIGNFVFDDMFGAFDFLDSNRIAYLFITSPLYIDSDKIIDEFIATSVKKLPESNSVFFQQLNELIKILEQKYGKGNDDTVRSVFDMCNKDGESYTSADIMRWTVGKKAMQVGAFRQPETEATAKEIRQQEIERAKIGKTESEKQELDKGISSYKQYRIYVCIYLPDVLKKLFTEEEKKEKSTNDSISNVVKNTF